MYRFALLILCALAPALLAEEPFQFDRTPGRLPKSVLPLKYEIRIEPDLDKSVFAGSQIVTIRVRQPVKELVFHSVDLEITKALVHRSGQEGIAATATFQPEKELCTLALAGEIAAGEHRLEIHWTGKLTEKPRGLYMTRYKTPSGGEKKALATQMEAPDARRMFPCWDEPAFRAIFEITAVIPQGSMAISNMPETRITKIPPARLEVAFAPTPSMSSYLVALCVGEFESLEDTVSGVKLRVLTTEGKREQARYALEATKKLLPYFNDYFGVPYPLPKLDQICFPSPPASGMENWGAIIYDDNAFLFDPKSSSQRSKERAFEVIAHELAHQWFGNLVTMGWWDNLWLNEGFASWMGTKATDIFNPEWQSWLRAAEDKEWAMVLDSRATTHPVQQPVETEAQANDAFDEITYLKGQSFIRMLELYLGEETFRQGVRSYMKKHAYQNTTTADLWTALEEVSGKQVRQFAAGWTEQPGFPVVRQESSCDGANTRLRYTQERFTINQRNAKPLTWQIPLTFARVDQLATAKVQLLGSGPVEATVPGCEAAVKGNVGATGFYRVAYDKETFDKLSAKLATLPEADRLNLAGDAWALVQAGHMKAASYLDLLAAVAASETSYPVLNGVLEAIGFIDSLQKGQTGRPAFRRWAVAALQPQMKRVGWEAAQGESKLTALLRSQLVRTLGKLGDPGVSEEARNRFDRYLKDPASLSGDLRGAVLRVAGLTADSQTYDALRSQALKELSTEKQRELYDALSGASDPELAARTLAISLGRELPPREATGLVKRVAYSGEHPELAWQFARENLDALLAKLSSLQANEYIPEVFGAFNDAERADELEAFAKSHLPPDASTAVAKTSDNIRFKAAFKKQFLPELDAWIASRQKAPRPE